MSKKSQAKPTAPAIALAAISPATASQVGKGLAAAVKRVEGAGQTFLRECLAAAALIGCPITSKQYDKQIAPDVRAAFNARGMTHLAETTRASYRSRLKTFCLAVNCGLEGFAPIAGETLPVYLARIAEPLSLAKLPDGRPIWESDLKAKPGRAAGTKVSPPARVHAASAGTVSDDEGGLDVKPALAAALILARNPARAQRLVIVMQSYAEDFDRWTASILTDADKAELGKLALPKADETPKTAAPVAPKGQPATAMAAALIQGQRKANTRKAATKAA